MSGMFVHTIHKRGNHACCMKVHILSWTLQCNNYDCVLSVSLKYGYIIISCQKIVFSPATATWTYEGYDHASCQVEIFWQANKKNNNNNKICSKFVPILPEFRSSFAYIAPKTCPNFTLSLSEYCRMSPGFGSNNNLLPEFCPNFAEFQAFTVLGG